MFKNTFCQLKNYVISHAIQGNGKYFEYVLWSKANIFRFVPCELSNTISLY